MIESKRRRRNVLIGIAALVLAAYATDSVRMQHKLSSLANHIDKKEIVNADLVYFPLNLKTQVPINTDAFEGFDAKTAEVWGIKQVSFGGASSEKSWNEINSCLNSTKFSRSILQLNPFFPDLRIKVTFHSAKNEILRTLYFDGETGYGLLDGNRGVYSGCLLSAIKRHMMGIQ